MDNNIPLWTMPPRTITSSNPEPVQPTFDYGTTFVNMVKDGFNNGEAAKIHYVGQKVLDSIDQDDIPLNDDQRKNFESDWSVKLPTNADANEARIIASNNQMKLNSQLMLSSADSFGKQVSAKAGYLTGQLAQVPAIIGGAAATAALSPEEGIVAGGSALIDGALNTVSAGIQGAQIGIGSQLANEAVNSAYDYSTGKNYSYKNGSLRVLDAGAMTFGMGAAGHIAGDTLKVFAKKYNKSRVNTVVSQMDISNQNENDIKEATAPETLRPVITDQKNKMIESNKSLVKLLASEDLPEVADVEPHPQTEKVNDKIVSVPTNIRNVGKKIKFWLGNFDNKSDVLPNALSSLHETLANNIKDLPKNVVDAFNSASDDTNKVLDRINDQVDWDLNSSSPGHNIGGIFKTFSPLQPSDEEQLNKIANANFELGRNFKMEGAIKDSLNKNAQQLLSKIKSMNIPPEEVAETLDGAFDNDKKLLDKNLENIKEIDKKVESNPDSESLKLKQSNLYDLQTTYVNSAMTHDYLRKVMRDEFPKPNTQDFIDGVENYNNQSNSVGAQGSQSVPTDVEEKSLESMRNEELDNLKSTHKSSRTSLEQKEISQSVFDDIKKNNLKRTKMKDLIESAYSCLLRNEP